MSYLFNSRLLKNSTILSPIPFDDSNNTTCRLSQLFRHSVSFNFFILLKHHLQRLRFFPHNYYQNTNHIHYLIFFCVFNIYIETSTWNVAFSLNFLYWFYGFTMTWCQRFGHSELTQIISQKVFCIMCCQALRINLIPLKYENNLVSNSKYV